MNRFGQRPSRWRRLVAAATLAASAGAIALGTAAPASAATMTARFSLIPRSNSYVCTNLSAQIPMGQYETWGYLNNGAHARVQMFGDDPVWDDTLFTSGWAYLNAGSGGVGISGTSTGIFVQWTLCTDRSFFDEDWDGDDELYVKVLVIDGDGYTLASAKSNVVTLGYIY